MIERILRNSAATLLLAATTLTVNGVPARRNAVYPLCQPDGTELNVIFHGNESRHYMTTTDGIPVVENAEGVVCFALAGENGAPVASTVVASNPDRRSAAAIDFIRANDPAKIRLALSSRPATSRAGAPRRNPGLSPSSFVARGEMKTLVVLVEFKDKRFTIDDPLDFYTRLFNEEGFSEIDGAYGSVRDYFVDNSRGQFRPSFDVYGPVRLDKRMSYYGENDWSGNDRYAHEMAIDACRKLYDEEGVTFDIYDFDEDGVVDNVYVIYAGYPESAGGGNNTVWPHSWDISESGGKYDLKFGKKTIDHYACSSELIFGTRPDGIGTPVHEFSHVIGLPDLYSTVDDYAEYTPGDWSVLDQGCYLDDSWRPAGYGMFERYALGWDEPVNLKRVPEEIVTLRAVSEGDGGIIPTDNTNEFFLVENRRLTGWDEYLPAHGMLAWHIDYSPYVWENNEVNNTKNHQRVDIIEADGKATVATAAGDVYPGSSFVTSLRPVEWSGKESPVTLSEIAENSDGTISFRLNRLTAIETVGADNAAEAEYWTIQGLRADPSNLLPGLYIRRRGATVEKILVD
ncbi:MAG: M6 family metalloprotease domain-containing protein [Clostridium sp.]|nr:M6 family metalloprotease domain-containing protein [Clostridium sp.]